MNNTNFDLNLLRVFDALMTERNVTRAAQRVFLSQPAMSHALARLRTELGDPLFVRAGREMIPTAKATSLRPVVSAALDQLTQALTDTRFDPLTSAVTYRIGSLDLAEYFLAPLITRLMTHEAPNIRYRVQAFDDSRYQAQLASGALDFVVGMPLPPAPGIYARRLDSQRLVGVVRKGHTLTRGRVTVNKFTQVPRLATVFRADRFEGPTDRVLGKAGIGGKVVYATPHYFAVPSLLRNSDLLLVTTEMVAKLLCGQHPLTVVAIPVRLPPVEPHIIWHERTHRDPAQQWMRSRLLQGMKELKSEASDSKLMQQRSEAE